MCENFLNKTKLKIEKVKFVAGVFLFSFSFLSYAYADVTVEGINVNLDTVTWNFPNSITLSNIFVQDNGMTLKLDDTESIIFSDLALLLHMILA
jgi:hypothetical protein